MYLNIPSIHRTLSSRKKFKIPSVEIRRKPSQSFSRFRINPYISSRLTINVKQSVNDLKYYSTSKKQVNRMLFYLNHLS